MKNYLPNAALLLFLWLLASCENNTVQTNPNANRPGSTQDSVLFRFVFMGCNRVDRHDSANPAATDASTANKYVLQRIFSEISQLPRQPELFFFLGDLVLGEEDTIKLDAQLSAWVALYRDTTFSAISATGIELVAVPGNHEMLFYKKVPGDPAHSEWPLAGATKVWMNYMAPFMPADRDRVLTDSLDNQMTFAFTRHNVGFIVMNTDTYNPPTGNHPLGQEGMIPTQWITDKIAAYRKDPKIEHIFILGHKPCYVDGQINTGHNGLPQGPTLWPIMNQYQVAAMLSAHVHDYQRVQPGNSGAYQIIAGNGGSSGPAEFFGYTLITVLKNGQIELQSIGFDPGNPYYAPSSAPSTVRDKTILSRGNNANPYQN